MVGAIDSIGEYVFWCLIILLLWYYHLVCAHKSSQVACLELTLNIYNNKPLTQEKYAFEYIKWKFMSLPFFWYVNSNRSSAHQNHWPSHSQTVQNGLALSPGPFYMCWDVLVIVGPTWCHPIDPFDQCSKIRPVYNPKMAEDKHKRWKLQPLTSPPPSFNPPDQWGWVRCYRKLEILLNHAFAVTEDGLALCITATYLSPNITILLHECQFCNKLFSIVISNILGRWWKWYKQVQQSSLKIMEQSKANQAP